MPPSVTTVELAKFSPYTNSVDRSTETAAAITAGCFGLPPLPFPLFDCAPIGKLIERTIPTAATHFETERNIGAPFCSAWA
jgi:hypothetical protein